MKLAGNKTYSVAIGMILTAISPVFTDDGFNIGAVNLPLLLEGFGLFTLRQGIKKVESGPPVTSMPDSAS